MPASTAPTKPAVKKATGSRTVAVAVMSPRSALARIALTPPAFSATRAGDAYLTTKLTAQPASKATGKSAANKQRNDTQSAAPTGIALEHVTGKPKFVRDSFTMPKLEYVEIEAWKRRATALPQAVKKSELLRAGVMALSAMPDKLF